MFNEAYSTPTIFVTDQNILPRVTVKDFGTDLSLTEVVKALLYDRIGEESFCATWENCIIPDAKTFAQKWLTENNNLTYLFLSNSDDLNRFRKWAKQELNLPFVDNQEAAAEMIKTKAGLNCAFYVRAEDLATLVVSTMPSLKQWHLLASMFFRFFKPFFAAKPLTKDEKEMMIALLNQSANSFAERAKILADRDDLNTLKLKSRLSAVRRQIYDITIETCKKTISDLEKRIKSIRNEYESTLYKIEEANMKLEGSIVMAESNKDNDELFNYFKDNKQITNVEAKDGCISFIVKTFLDVYDPDLYRDYAKTGHIFAGYSGYVYNPEEIKLLMDAIFSEEPEFRIKMKGWYSLNLQGIVKTRLSYPFPSSMKAYVANPHLDLHACLGSYEPEINKLLRSGNIVGAVEQCIASCKSVNIGEVTMTFKPMMNKLFCSKEKLLQRSDGTDMTVPEAITYLKEKEHNA